MKIKDTLKSQFEGLLTEDTLNVVQEAFDAAVDTKVQEKLELQVESAILKKTEEIDADHAKKLEALVESIDADHAKKLEALVESIDNDHVIKLKATLNKIDEDHTAKVEALIEHIDEDHTNKMQKVLETVDFDRSVKLQSLVEKLDKDHCKKLQAVINKYENIIAEGAKQFQGKLVEDVSGYIDLYLEKNIPTQQISEAVENIKSRKLVEQIRSLVGINEEFIDLEVKEALLDGKKTIDSLKKELNESMLLNTRLNHNLQKASASILIEQKTRDLPEAVKNFTKRVLKDKAPEYIEENFQYVVEMYDTESSNKEEFARSKAKTRVLTEAVDRPVSNDNQVEIVESFGASSEDPVSDYLSEMKRLSR